MFNKITNAADRLATNVSESRRGFLGSLGKGAVSLAGALAGLLVLSGKAWAVEVNYCRYRCPNGTYINLRTLRCLCRSYIGWNGMTCTYVGCVPGEG